jgi:hypothetical protein
MSVNKGKPKERMVTMLPITAKIRTLVKELDSAINFCNDLIPVLEGCTSSSELPEKVGVFARKMPEYKVLADERQGAFNLIRKVCTLELSTSEAAELCKKYRDELKANRKLINL